MNKNIETMRTCIYCKETKNVNLFTTEHVIPKAFGTFGTETFILDCVCDNCNKYFGNKLEVFFARGSLEAFERFKRGIKSVSESSKINKHRLTFKINYGDYNNVLVEMVTENNELKFNFVAQVGFFSKKHQTYEFFSLTDLEFQEKIEKEKYDFSDSIGIIYWVKDEKEIMRVTKVLSKHGITFKKRADLPTLSQKEDKIPVEAISIIDRLATRTICKILFNYMAKICGPDFALNPSFDPTRSFIRDDRDITYKVMRASNTSILYYDKCFSTMRQTDGHLIVLETVGSTGKLIGKLSLFNTITYEVVLCQYFNGIFRSIRTGHHFDWRNKIIELLNSSSIILV